MKKCVEELRRAIEGKGTVDMDRYVEKLKTMVAMGKCLAHLSTCKRDKVSAIIFPTDCTSVYAIGYNGPPRGLSNDRCSGEEGRCGCVHAEANAIAKFSNDQSKPSILFSTRAPCVACAGLILNCYNIRGIIFEEDYRDGDGLQLLQEAKLCVIKEMELDATTHETEIKYWKGLCKCT